MGTSSSKELKMNLLTVYGEEPFPDSWTLAGYIRRMQKNDPSVSSARINRSLTNVIKKMLKSYDNQSQKNLLL